LTDLLAFPYFDLQIFRENDPPVDPPQPSADLKPKDPPKPADPPSDPPDDDLSKKTAAELAEYAKSLRRQNADYRTRAKTAASERDELKQRFEAEDRKKAEDEKRFQDIAKSEEDKRKVVERERDDARAEIARVKVFNEVRDHARTSGLKNVKILDRLDMSALKIQDDGSVDELEVIKFVRGVKEEYPELFAAPASDPPPAPPKPSDPKPPLPKPNPIGDKTDWRSLTPEQFAAKEKELLGSSSSQRW